MNREWVDKIFAMMCSRVGIFAPDPNTFYFEPTAEVYAQFESGDERHLQSVVTLIAEHLSLTPIPSASYEWGLKMEPETAGRISLRNSQWLIQIPFFYAGKKYAVGSILAHEMAHAFLASKGVGLPEVEEDEMLTDLAAVFLGLGKLFLNGLFVITNEDLNEGNVLGYLPHNLVLHSYRKVNDYRSIAWDTAVKNLLPDVVRRLSES
jgi:hypothetical protein